MAEKTKIVEMTRLDVLMSEKNKVLPEIVKLEIDIATLERTDPNIVIAKRTLAENSRGEVIASQDLKVPEMLEKYREDLKGNNIRLTSIEQMLKDEK